MSNEMSHDVFISFSFNDQEKAEYIVNKLSSVYGIKSWICTRDIDGGRRYKRLIPQAIRVADVVVFLQSQSALSSKEIPKEIGIAFDNNKVIIPFKLDDSQPSGELEYDLYISEDSQYLQLLNEFNKHNDDLVKLNVQLSQSENVDFILKEIKIKQDMISQIKQNIDNGLINFNCFLVFLLPIISITKRS